MSGVKKWTKKLSRSEAHDYPYRNPEYLDVVSRVEQMYLAEDAKTFEILHAIANLAIQGEIE